MSVTWEIEEL